MFSTPHLAERHVNRLRLCAGTLVLTVLAASCTHDARRFAGPSRGPTFSSVASRSQSSLSTDADEFLVEYTGSTSRLTAAVASVGGAVARVLPELGLATVTGLDDARAARLARSPGVTSATRDLVVQWIAPLAPSVGLVEADADVLPAAQNPPQTAPFLGLQWNLRTIHAPEAWATGNLGQGVRVAILDTGIDDTHPEMQGRVDRPRSFAFTPNQFAGSCGAAPCPTWGDDNLHGTHVASVIASNAFRTASIAPGASLIAVKVLNRDGAGTFGTIIAGILYATNVGADIINLSLGAYFPKNAPGGGQLNGALAKAVNYAVSHGVFVVAAAGNDGANLDADGNFISAPAQSGAAFAVSATGPLGQVNFDQLAFYSNFGRSGPAVAAPGGNFLPGPPPVVDVRDLVLGPCSRQSLEIPDCATGTFYVFAAGTSAASPHAAGVAALVEGHAGGGLTAGQLRTRIEQSADDLGKPGVDLVYSHGRINAFRAVTQ